MRILIEDEGIGFDVSVPSRPGLESGFGLFNIQERLTVSGGRVIVRSKPGRGTRITLIAPLLRSAATRPDHRS